MLISWYNKVGRERTCNITIIDDIQKYDEGGLFCLRIRSDNVFPGSVLGEFQSVEERDNAYNDIKAALDAGIKKEFRFRAGYYKHIL